MAKTEGELMTRDPVMVDISAADPNR